MKKKLYINILLFSLFLFFSLHLTAQRGRHENVIKLDLVEPFYSTLGASFEKFIPDTDFSIQFNGSLTTRKITVWESLAANVRGYGAELQGRYYFSMKHHTLPSGVYNGIYAKYAPLKITMHIPEGDVNILDGNSKIIGFFAGYQHGFGNRFFVDATFGGGYHIADYRGKFSQKGRVIPSIISSGIIPKFDVKMGVAF